MLQEGHSTAPGPQNLLAFGLAEPLKADDPNFYKVEKWTKDGPKVDRILYAGSNPDKGREVFHAATRADDEKSCLDRVPCRAEVFHRSN